jgi:hypothetical protein
MTAELITQSDLGVMLSMGGRNAREFCARHGVLPINVGKGKRASLRWSRSAVMQMLCTLQADAGAPRRKAVRSKTNILGKTAASLHKELAAVQ